MTAPDGERPPARIQAPPGPSAAETAAHWVDETGPVTLARLLDDAAVAVHSVTIPKMLLAALGGVTASLILPLPVSVAWAVVGAALALLSWSATRARAAERAVGWRGRVRFVAALACEDLWWLFLGVLFWRTGSVQGEAAAVVIFSAIASVSLLLFYNTPALFLIAGALPAIAALSISAMRVGYHLRELAPLWLALSLAMIFCLGRALDTPSTQQQQRRLNDSLNKYRILAENVTDIISRTDMKGMFQYLSPAVLNVLGYRPDELIGTWRGAIIHSEAAAMAFAAFERMRADPSRSEVITVRVRHKDGRWLWLQTNIRMVCEDGVPVGMIDVSRDVTERVAAEKALVEAKAEAEAANRAKAEFLANVSHEIRTPMNGVLGALHLLERENISPEGRELMRQAADCGRMLTELLNDVLDFSKIEAGQLQLSPEPMDAGDALRTVTALLNGQARAKGVELRCEIVGDNPWIVADPGRLRQAMFNLVGNAVKFTLDGHVTARLLITAAGKGRSHVRLEVEDTGVGIPLDAQESLFERFRQVDGGSARRFGGTGLGLAITRSLARAMGGEVGLASIEGEGSTFWLAFEAAEARPARTPETDHGLLEGISILLVEDNSTNRLMARTLLQRLGARVEEAEDGAQGLEAARHGGHDLILMDVQMPHMNGVEATRAIRALAGPVSRVPIIGLTANVMVQQQAEYRAAGMDAVVAKPISPANLLAEIGRLFNQPDDRLAG